MIDFTEHHLKLLEITNDAVIEIRTALKGMDGQGGLIKMVTDVCADHKTLKDDHERLKGNYKALVGILVGSGILSGAAVAAITKIIGG